MWRNGVASRSRGGTGDQVPKLKLSLLEAHVRRLCGDLDKIETQLESKGIQITSCPGICSLNLASNNLRIEGVADAYRAAILFAALRRNEYCIALNMSSNPLGPVSGIVFGSFLKENRNLHTLNLSRVSLGDEGVRMLAMDWNRIVHFTLEFRRKRDNVSRYERNRWRAERVQTWWASNDMHKIDQKVCTLNSTSIRNSTLKSLYVAHIISSNFINRHESKSRVLTADLTGLRAWQHFVT